jgi:murein L,D-transpeptidase YafK
MRQTLFALVLAVAVGCGLAACDLYLSETPLKAGARADRIVVHKNERVLELMAGDVTLKRYTIALGREPVGAKQHEGDGRTPEGRYRIDYRNPASGYHLALHISYPDGQDRARARKAGVSPGGDIMIHGMRNGYGWIGPLHRLFDWTNGCIAVTDAEMDEIWRAVANGTEIEIRP